MVKSELSRDAGGCERMTTNPAAASPRPARASLGPATGSWAHYLEECGRILPIGQAKARVGDQALGEDGVGRQDVVDAIGLQEVRPLRGAPAAEEAQRLVRLA